MSSFRVNQNLKIKKTFGAWYNHAPATYFVSSLLSLVFCLLVLFSYSHAEQTPNIPQNTHAQETFNSSVDEMLVVASNLFTGLNIAPSGLDVSKINFLQDFGITSVGNINVPSFNIAIDTTPRLKNLAFSIDKGSFSLDFLSTIHPAISELNVEDVLVRIDSEYKGSIKGKLQIGEDAEDKAFRIDILDTSVVLYPYYGEEIEFSSDMTDDIEQLLSAAAITRLTSFFDSLSVGTTAYNLQLTFNRDLDTLQKIEGDLSGITSTWIENNFAKVITIDNPKVHFVLHDPLGEMQPEIELEGSITVHTNIESFTFNLNIPFDLDIDLGKLIFSDININLDVGITLGSLVACLPNLFENLNITLPNISFSSFGFLNWFGIDPDAIEISLFDISLNPDFSFKDISFGLANLGFHLNFLSAIIPGFDLPISIQDLIVSVNQSLFASVIGSIRVGAEDVAGYEPFRIDILTNDVVFYPYYGKEITFSADTIPTEIQSLLGTAGITDLLRFLDTSFLSATASNLRLTFNRELDLCKKIEADVGGIDANWINTKLPSVFTDIIDLTSIRSYISMVNPFADQRINNGQRDFFINVDLGITINEELLGITISIPATGGEWKVHLQTGETLSLSDFIEMIRIVAGSANPMLNNIPIEKLGETADFGIDNLTIRFDPTTAQLNSMTIDTDFTIQIPTVTFAGQRIQAISLDVRTFGVTFQNNTPEILADLKISIPNNIDTLIKNPCTSFSDLLEDFFECQLRIDSYGAVSLKMQSWPLKIGRPQIITRLGEKLARISFGKNGSLEFELPTIRYDGTIFSVEGRMTQRRLRISFEYLKKLLKGSLLDCIADLLPWKIPQQTDASWIECTIETFGGNMANLPDAFQTYLTNMQIPNTINYKLETFGGDSISVGLSLPDGQALALPILVLIPPSQIQMIGIKLNGFALGQIFGFMTVDIDAEVDSFNIKQMAALSALPQNSEEAIITNRKKIQAKFIAKNLFAILSPAGNPVGLFFDEVSLNYNGIEGIEAKTKWSFPKPEFSQVASILGMISDYVIHVDSRITPSDVAALEALTLTIDPTYLKLPKYLNQTEVFNLEPQNISSALYSTEISHLLNAIKHPNMKDILLSIPQDIRIGTLSSLGNIPIPFGNSIKWALTNKEEIKTSHPNGLVEDDINVIGFNGQDVSSDTVVALISGDIKQDPLSLGVKVGVGAKNNLALGLGAKIEGELSSLISLDITADSYVDLSVPSSGLDGTFNVKALGNTILDGTARIGTDGIALTGEFDNGNLPINLSGNIGGELTTAGELTLAADMQASILGMIDFGNAHVTVTNDTIEIGTQYLGTDLTLAVEQEGNFLVVNGTASKSITLPDINFGTIEIPIPGIAPHVPDTTLSVGPLTLSPGGVAADLTFTIRQQNVSLGVTALVDIFGLTREITFTLNEVPTTADVLMQEISTRVKSMAEDMIQNMLNDPVGPLKAILQALNSTGIVKIVLGDSSITELDLSVQDVSSLFTGDFSLTCIGQEMIKGTISKNRN